MAYETSLINLIETVAGTTTIAHIRSPWQNVGLFVVQLARICSCTLECSGIFNTWTAEKGLAATSTPTSSHHFETAKEVIVNSALTTRLIAFLARLTSIPSERSALRIRMLRADTQRTTGTVDAAFTKQEDEERACSIGYSGRLPKLCQPGRYSTPKIRSILISRAGYPNTGP